MRAELADGLAALHEERLVVLERTELTHDDVEALPAPRGLPRAAVDHEVVRALGHVGVEVVVQHPEGGFLDPALAGELAPRGGMQRARRGHGSQA
jgi:hypothetical protein